jgi:hypothetical protein
MKRADLIRKLEEAGCKFVRHRGNPATGRSTSLLRSTFEETVTIASSLSTAIRPPAATFSQLGV